MHECPKCQADDIHRSHTRSIWEVWRKKITGRRPYRCHACDWRGWGADLGSRFVDDDPEGAARLTAAAGQPGLKMVRTRRGMSDAEISRIDATPDHPRKRG